MGFSFPKSIRLSSKKEIDLLFTQGKSFTVGPFRILYRIASIPPEPCQLVISVPKKHHKRAVIRNRLKRRIRECFRLQYPSLLAPALEGKHLHLTFLCIYLPHEVFTYAQLEPKMRLVLERLSAVVQKSTKRSLSDPD